MCNRIAAIYALESVLNALFWHCTRSSIVILVWCLKSILGYTIYCGIYGDFQDMYTIYCGVLVSVVQYDYLCILYSFVECYLCMLYSGNVCELIIILIFVLRFWCCCLVYVFWCGWYAGQKRSCLIDIVVSILEYWYNFIDNILSIFEYWLLM